MGLTKVQDSTILCSLVIEWRATMNLITIFTRFPDQEACLEQLEALRWGAEPTCPHCESQDVARKADGTRQGRWNCHTCRSSFTVLSGTIFEKTRIPLQKWFLAIGLIVNAKKSLSSCQLARDLSLTQPTAWYVQTRIRSAMVSKQRMILQGIVEMDETFIGGKPRRANKKEDPTPKAPGRATLKTPVVGAVERGGHVTALATNSVTGKGVLRFIQQQIDTTGSLLMTDQYKAYHAVKSLLTHAVINHRVQYADGDTHTNTIEGFWSLLKRAGYGSHHHDRKQYLPLYVAEACWKYNARKQANPFRVFLDGCFA